MSDVSLVDRKTRNVPRATFDAIDSGTPLVFEADGHTLRVVGTFTIGGGFAADGFIVVSDQTFLRLFPQRSAGAPNHVFIKLQRGADPAQVSATLRALLPSYDSKVHTVDEAVKQDQSFQTTQRPVGLIFGFGLIIGVLVGIIIAYQVLSTDVADHLKECATFKAIRYRHGFFLGIVFEEAFMPLDGGDLVTATGDWRSPRTGSARSAELARAARPSCRRPPTCSTERRAAQTRRPSRRSWAPPDITCRSPSARTASASRCSTTWRHRRRSRPVWSSGASREVLRFRNRHVAGARVLASHLRGEHGCISAIHPIVDHRPEVTVRFATRGTVERSMFKIPSTQTLSPPSFMFSSDENVNKNDIAARPVSVDLEPHQSLRASLIESGRIVLQLGHVVYLLPSGSTSAAGRAHGRVTKPNPEGENGSVGSLV